MNKIKYALIIPLVFLNISGCAPLIIGGAVGALGAYAISKDTIQGDTDKSYDELWASAVVAANSKGTLKQEDKSQGYIELTDKSNRVYIKLVRLTRATVRIKVSARKHHFPNLGLAQELYTKIIEGI